MIPRTVQMAKEVLATFTGPQYDDYGNIILNGYSYYYPSVNTAGAKGSLDAVSLTAGTGYVNGTYTGVFLSSEGGGNYGYADITVAGGTPTVVTLTSGGSGFTVGEKIYLGNLPQTAPGTGTPAYLTVSFVNESGVTPALKGWTNNYQEYYTQLQPNGYGVNPGDPTMFEYDVHSFTPYEGPITGINGFLNNGTGYTPGTYLGVATTTSGIGTGATLDVIVSPATGSVTTVSLLSGGYGYPVSSSFTASLTQALTGGGYGLRLSGTTNGSGAVATVTIPAGFAGINYQVGDIVQIDGGTAQVSITGVTTTGVVTSMTLVAAGANYSVGDTLYPTLVPGAGASIQVTDIDLQNITGGGDSKWAQPPHRLINEQVADFVPPGPNQQAIQYSAILYPVADNPTPPPIDTL